MTTDRRLLFVMLCGVAAAITACGDQAHESPVTDEAALVGHWVWPGANGGTVSTLVITDALDVEQTSVFYPTGATSTYTLTRLDDALWLDGWFARDTPCEPARQVCDDQGRVRQLQAMSWYADDDVFFPIAMHPLGGDTWQGDLLTMAPLPGRAEDEPVVVAYDEWTLELGADGRFASRHTRTDYLGPDGLEPLDEPVETVVEESAGAWAITDQGATLQLTHDDGRVAAVARAGEVLSLDTLVFERADAGR